MPEEAQQEEIAAPSRSGGRKMGPVVVAGGVLVLLLGVVAVVVIMGKRASTQYTKQGGDEVHPREWLDIPPVEMKDVLLSISLMPGSPQRKQLTVDVVVRFAPPEGETADIKELEKEFVPRVNRLKPEFRHIIIDRMSARDYGQLSSSEIKNQLLKTFKLEFNKKLKRYDLHKMGRVHDVFWGRFFWQ